VSEKEFLAQLKEHQNIIYKLVHLYANTEDDKKDLYQEIVLQAWKTYGAFRGEAKFSTWLYRLCLNTIFTIQRKTNRIEYTDTAKFEETYTIASGNDEVDRLYRAIRTLPETERAIISLHLDGYDNKEVGELIGITANLVAVKLHRIKQQLASLLKNI
jgi:RNA polymerase sigma factor (sigma-70 family)